MYLLMCEKNDKMDISHSHIYIVNIYSYIMVSNNYYYNIIKIKLSKIVLI